MFFPRIIGTQYVQKSQCRQSELRSCSCSHALRTYKVIAMFMYGDLINNGVNFQTLS